MNTVKSYLLPDPRTNSIDFSEYIFSLFKDSKDRIWYGSANFGYFDPAVNRFTNFFYPADFSQSPVKLKKIFAISETEGNRIWLGTENAGIATINCDIDNLSYANAYTQKNGLTDNRIKEMLSDKNNSVWIITAKGLSKISASNEAIENYNRQYGLIDLNFLSLLNDGRIFAGSNSGYYLFNPDSIKPFNNKPEIYIKSFKVFDKKVYVNPFAIDNDPLKLKYDEDFFSVEYGLLNYFKNSEVSFSYKLDGFDEHWHYAGKRTYLSYSNVEGGEYILKIKSSYGNKIEIPVIIETPFWETWWFFTLIIISFLGLLLSGHLYRLHQLRKREKIKSDYDKELNRLEMKALRAQMNPHFMFNSLNSIRYYILKNDNANAAEYITKFSKLLRLILNNSRQNLISLKDELNALEIYIDFEQMRFNNKFWYQINISQGFDTAGVKIQPMVIQPFVENAIWHGLMPKEEKGYLKIDVSKTEHAVIITIMDNGIGRQKAKEMLNKGLIEAKSFGLKIMEDRMTLMESIRGKKSDFKIIDLFDRKKPVGTKIIITFEM